MEKAPKASFMALFAFLIFLAIIDQTLSLLADDRTSCKMLGWKGGRRTRLFREAQMHANKKTQDSRTRWQATSGEDRARKSNDIYRRENWTVKGFRAERKLSTSRKRPTATLEFNRYLQTLIKSNSSNVEAAEGALWQQVDLGKSNYDIVSFNIVLNGWAKRRSLYGAQRADGLLGKLIQLQQSHKQLEADTYSYSAVLSAYAKCGGGKTAALRAEELLEQLQFAREKLGTDICHNAVMDAWSVSGDPRAGTRAESWLRKLESPSRISYNSVIKAYARSQAPEEAQRLLQEMQNLAKTTSPHLEPDKISISTCIDAWSKGTTNLTEAAFKADTLLEQMEADLKVTWNKNNAVNDANHQISSKHPPIDKRPDVVTYTAVLTAYARSGLPETAGKAVELIRRMEKYSDAKPNAPFYNALIHLLAKTKYSPRRTGGLSSSPEQTAEAILKEMKKRYEESREVEIRPCKITYTAVISVYARHDKSVAAAERVEELLNELESLYNHTGLDAYLPNTKTFGAVLSVWANTALLSNTSSYRATVAHDALWKKAGLVLGKMEDLYRKTKNPELKPTSILYSQVFRILANGRDPQAAERGLMLLKKMKKLSTDTDFGEFIRVDSTIYAYLVVAFTKASLENLAEAATTVLRNIEEAYKHGNGDLKPTSLLYSAVLQAYAKSGSPKLACDLLERTKELYRAGKMYAKPTTLFYNAVIDAHARSNGGRQAAERAEALLEEMETRGRAGDPELSLTARSYNAAILAWKNSNAPDAPQRAEALLKRMTDMYKAGNKLCRPDRVTINSIIGVWAKKSPQQGASERAREFLEFLENSHHSSGDPSIKPDRYSYNSVIDAYSRSSAEGAARQAQTLYERMKALAEAGDEDITPDIITLTSLRKAWMNALADNGNFYVQRIEKLILAELSKDDEGCQASEPSLPTDPFI